MDEDAELRNYLANALGGVVKGKRMAPPWAPNEMGSEDCYLIETSTNRVLIEAMLMGDVVGLAIIHVENKGIGFGSEIMEALADFAEERGLAIHVSSVKNPAFFSKFEWLNDDYRSTFGPQIDDDD